MKADEIPIYAVYDLSTKGFKIKLSQAATFDLNFSWTALAVSGENVSTSGSSDSSSLDPVPTVQPAAPLPSPEVEPSPESLESASPSASAPN